MLVYAKRKTQKMKGGINGGYQYREGLMEIDLRDCRVQKTTADKRKEKGP